MRKPNWKDAPEWAMYLAQDAVGSWCWYQEMPEWEGEYWFVSTGISEFVEPCYDPTDTLESRP